MRMKTVISVGATKTAVEYPVADFNSPFTRGRECVLMIRKNAAYNAGNLLIETDNAADGSYSDVRALGNGDGSVEQVEMYNLTLGDNIRVTTGTWVAGTLDIILLGDT